MHTTMRSSVLYSHSHTLNKPTQVVIMFTAAPLFKRRSTIALFLFQHALIRTVLLYFESKWHALHFNITHTFSINTHTNTPRALTDAPFSSNSRALSISSFQTASNSCRSNRPLSSMAASHNFLYSTHNKQLPTLFTHHKRNKDQKELSLKSAQLKGSS